MVPRLLPVAPEAKPPALQTLRRLSSPDCKHHFCTILEIAQGNKYTQNMSLFQRGTHNIFRIEIKVSPPLSCSHFRSSLVSITTPANMLHPPVCWSTYLSPQNPWIASFGICLSKINLSASYRTRKYASGLAAVMLYSRISRFEVR